MTAAAAALEATVMTASGAGSEAMSDCTIITPSVAAKFVPHCGKSCSICTTSLKAQNVCAKPVSTAGKIQLTANVLYELKADHETQQLHVQALGIASGDRLQGSSNSMKGRQKGNRDKMAERKGT